MKTPAFLPALVTIALCSSATAQEKQTFPIEWQVGKTYLQTVSMDQTTTMLGQGEMVMKMNSEMTAVPKAGEAAGTTDVTMTYRKMEFSMQMGGQAIPGADDAMKDFVGKSMVVTFGKDGKVLDVSTEGLGDVMNNPMTAQLMNEESMKQMFAQGTLLTQPDEPVAPGETWDFEFVYPNPMMKMEMSGTYKYAQNEEVEGAKVARLEFDGKLDTEPAAADEKPAEGEAGEMAEAMKAMGLKISDSKISGVSLYDFELRNFTRTDMQMDMTMSMNNPADGTAMQMPVKSKVVQTLKVQDEE